MSKAMDLRVNSVRVYYLNHVRMIEETAKFVYGLEQDNLENVHYTTGAKLKTWAMKKMKVDKKRNFKLEVRTTKGRFLFDK